MGLVLIADDNPHAHRMGRQILSQEGHDVVTVSSGDEAMEYLDSNRPDLVMADTRMPGPSGYEVCRRVKQQGGSLEGVKVVLLAGPLEPFDSEQAQECGSDAVLHKPLDAFTLIDTVNSLIGKPDPSSAGEHDAAVADPPEPEANFDPPEDIDEIQSGETWGSKEAPASPEDLEKARQEVEALKAATAAAVAEPEQAAAGEPSPAPSLDDDPFGDLVRETLAPAETEEQRRAKVRAAVSEVLEAALPTIVDTITERVWASLHKQDS